MKLNYLNEILYLLGPDRHKLPIMVMMFLAISFLDLAGIGMIGPYVALVVDPEAMDGTLGHIVDWLGMTTNVNKLLIILGGGLFVIFLLKTISMIGINYVIIKFGHKQMVRLRSLLMQNYQSLSYNEYLQRNSSQYIHSIQNLTGGYSFVVKTLLRVISNCIIGMAILGFLAWVNGPVLLLLAGLLLTMIFAYDRIFRVKLKTYGEKANRATVLMTQGIYEGIEGLKEIRILGKESYFFRKVYKGSLELGRYGINQEVITTMPRFLIELIVVSFIILLVNYLIFLEQETKTMLPTLGIFGIAVLRLLPTVTMLTNSISQLRYARDNVSRLYKDLGSLKHLKLEKPMDKKISHTHPFHSMTLQHINFYYPNSQSITLNNISIDIRVGEAIGIFGPSGTGKTTLIDVLLGLLEPQEGKLIYNGKHLNKNLNEWHSQVAYLPQQVFLIDDTLRRNIALGVEENNIEEAHIIQSIKRAKLLNLIDELPDGINTYIGERGVRLSGGQRQRVALARAFYHDRSVLIMDESTSNLDNETEQEIIEEIKHLKGDKTIIVIAHRLSTLAHCDRIYFMEQGHISKVGTPEQLLGIT
jgi:ATP-binding cassette, subfamily B, bacterial PglK